LIDPWVWFQFFAFQDSWFPLLPKKNILNSKYQHIAQNWIF
jgi:hypothetical protein